MRNKPKASIIVPAFNAANYLPRCIESLLQQTESDIEVIIVNDGSTDRTLEIASQYAEEDSRVLIIDQSNRGPSHARNEGMSRAVGDFIFFADSDDWVEPSMVEEMVNRCESSNADVVIAGITIDYFDKKNNLIYSEIRRPDAWVFDTKEQLPIGTVTETFINLLGFPVNKAYKRDFLLKTEQKFPIDVALYEDVQFNSKVLSEASRVAFLGRSYYHYVRGSRASLITIREEKFLTLSYLAISSIDSLLDSWHVNDRDRKVYRANASGSALWVGTNGALTKSQPRTFLQSLLESEYAEELVTLAIPAYIHKKKDRWIAWAVRNKWNSLALASLRTIQPARRNKAYFQKVFDWARRK